MPQLSVSVLGAMGRMGRLLTQEILDSGDMHLAGAVTSGASPEIGRDAAMVISGGGHPCGINLTDDPEPAFANASIVIDFSSPSGVAKHAVLAGRTARPLLVGVTGLTQKTLELLDEAGKMAPILVAPNTSLAMTLMAAMTEQVAAILGPESFDIEILETHHRQKRDGPSGAALSLGEAAARGRGARLADLQDERRHGYGEQRQNERIGIAFLRGGQVAGEHAVFFLGDGEQLMMRHRADHRRVFVQGALRGARWLASQQPGLYTMRDVLPFSFGAHGKISATR